MKKFLLILLTCTATLFSPLAHAREDPALQAIPSLDVPRYMGTWYEIAKYPNRFQKKCLRNTTAQYSQQQDGTIKVVNTCLQAEGKVREVQGEARQVGASNSAQLEVRFAPAWLSWLPMVWGDYWVIDIDPQYQLAAVSEPDRDLLWIMSRTPQVSQTHYDALLARLRAKGFDLDKLEPTLHTK